MMIEKISGQRQLEFMKRMDYVHEAGTPEELRAAHSIQDYLASFGVDSHLEAFDFYSWRVLEATLTVTEPFEQSYKVMGYGRCGSTPAEGIEAPFLYIENCDPINLALAKGKIVMTNFPMDPGMHEQLVKAEVAGFISIMGSLLDTGDELNLDARNIPAGLGDKIQGCMIHLKDAIDMVERGASRVRLYLKHEDYVATSHNVIARIPGSDLADQVLTLTAHYDSFTGVVGAYDNMAGAAIIMELCRYFKEHQPRRTIEFIWFGAEETGLCGSRSYVQVHKDELKNHYFNMNVDLAGQLVGNSIICVTGDSAICPLIDQMALELGIGVSTVHGVWGSDSNSFAASGVPAMTICRNGFGMHTHHDIMAYISPWALHRSACLLGTIADKFANIDTLPFTQEIPEAFKPELVAFFKRYKDLL